MLAVDTARLQADIEDLSRIGRRENHGLYRMAFTPGDQEGRAWLKQRIADAQLDLYEDGAANIHARLNWDGTRPSVMTGSHLDTVPGAGHLDGALGVLVALECLRCLKEQQVPLRHAVEAVAFSDEEGRFGGLLGSQAMAGMLTPERILNARDLEGVTLTDAMAACGYDAMQALYARRPPDSLVAFLELHIEQGPVLDRKGCSVGVVNAIAGLFKWEIKLIGVANHAGTTPMDMRSDAFQGAAEFAAALERILEENGSPRSVATIGRMDLTPGAANVVPGLAVFSLDVRDTDPEVLQELGEACRRTLSSIARRRNLMFEFQVLSEIEPVKCDPGIIDTILRSADRMDLDTLPIHSGAAHDTQIMAHLTRTGMIFVPSKEGRSHSIAEWTAMEDIERGANLMLNTLQQLAGSE